MVLNTFHTLPVDARQHHAFLCVCIAFIIFNEKFIIILNTNIHQL